MANLAAPKKIHEFGWEILLEVLMAGEVEFKAGLQMFREDVPSDVK